MKALLALILTGALFAPVCSYAQANGTPPPFPTPLKCPSQPFDPLLTMQYAHTPPPENDLSIVIAHRGGYWENAPADIENSALAMGQAAATCIESVEFDVRLSSDGLPVLIHDWNLQRVTSGTNLVDSIPYSGTGGWITLATRDRYGNISSTLTPTVGNTGLTYLREILDAMVHYPSLMVVLDCKENQGYSPNSYDVLKETLQVVEHYEQTKGVSLRPRIMFKSLFRELPATTALFFSGIGVSTACAPNYISTCVDPYGSGTGGFNFAPVWHPGDNIPAAMIQRYLTLPMKGGSTPSTYSAMWYPETDVPYPGGELQTYIGAAAGSNVVSVAVANDDWPEGISQSPGTCCTDRNTLPAVSSTSSYKGDLEYDFSQQYGRVVADKAFEAMSYLQAQGRRNVCRLVGLPGPTC